MIDGNARSTFPAELPVWLCRVLGALTLGGGAIGFVSVFGVLYAGTGGWLTTVFNLAFLFLYLLGALTGIGVIERKRLGTPLIFYWFLQVPLVSSGWISYQFSSGAQAYLVWARDDLMFNSALGSSYALAFGSASQSSIGINAVAVVALILLFRYRHGSTTFLPRRLQILRGWSQGKADQT